MRDTSTILLSPAKADGCSQDRFAAGAVMSVHNLKAVFLCDKLELMQYIVGRGNRNTSETQFINLGSIIISLFQFVGNLFINGIPLIWDSDFIMAARIDVLTDSLTLSIA